MGIGTIRRFATVAALPLLIAGCDLLAGALYPELDPFAPNPFVPPGAGAQYEVGSATIELQQGDGSQTIVLGEVADGSELTELGATVTWRSDDGWALTLSHYSDPYVPGGGWSDVTFQRVRGTELWTVDYADTHDRCFIQIREATDERIRGSVECDGLRWVDGLGGPNPFGTPRYVEGQQLFHLHVEFEATPDDTLRS